MQENGGPPGPIVVQKYGGSSLANAERIRNAARRICAALDAGQRVVVVVSAMGDSTDELLTLARALSPEPHERELDSLLSTGEQVSASLMAITLQAMGRGGISLTAGQAGIIPTDCSTGPGSRRCASRDCCGSSMLARCRS
jgi:aspartate kinase